MSDRILPLQAVSTDVLRRYLFAISQYCRSVSDLTNEDKLAPTPFHSCEEPPISLGTYVIDLGRRLRLCRFTVLLATLYVGRMAQRTKRMPSILSIHRLFASAMLLACKALRDNVPSDDVFAQCAGFPPNEVSELQTAFQRTVGHDAHDYAVDLEAMHRHLEVASRTTLRSRITSAVANAFRVDPPMSAVPSPSRDVISISPVSPGLLSVMSPVFTSLCTTPLHSADPWRRSSDSQYVFGSGVTAARNLRSVSPNPEGLSFVLPPAEVEVTPSSPLPTFAIQMPRCLEEEGTIELPVTTDAPVAPSRPTRPRPFFMARRF